MPKATIDTAVGTADSLPAGGAKINANFDELYAFLGDGDTLQASQVEQLYASQVPDASQNETETGTEAAIRRFSPLRLFQSVAAWVDANLSAVATSGDFADLNSVPVEIGVACSDEFTALLTDTGVATFRAPHAITLTGLRANVAQAPVGSKIIADMRVDGVSILSTPLSIDAGQKTSVGAAVPAVISDPAIADDAEIIIDLTQVGSTFAGAGLKLWLIGTRT